MFGKYSATVCARLRELRLDLGLTQNEFARTVGVSKIHVCKYENCMYSPSLDVIHSVAVVYGVSPDWLFGRSDDKYIFGEKNVVV